MTFRRLTIAAVVALAVALVAVVGSTGLFRVRGPAETMPPTPQMPAPVRETASAAPVYEGPLGDFIVGSHQGSSLPPCPRPWRLSTRARIEASELYSPFFGDLEGLVTECADGTITGIEIYGPEITSRVYFVGKKITPIDAPRERLRLLTVAGKPALAVLPSLPGELSLVVIERFPSNSRPGISLTIRETTMSLEETIELAVRIMRIGGNR